uniref:Uncharacterized protein n=1 Tax=viral metagenome TaxID=1070528 RepID=A0A6M3LM50_9ZZZZ
MTKKDYIQIAKALKEVHKTTPADASAMHTFDRVVSRLVDMLQADNGRFDRDKFANAIYR